MGDVHLSVLPEGCIANILTFTCPRDACASSVVSSIFKSAADSDVVWEKFLPSDYREIVSRSDSPSSLSFPSKKKLYFRICSDPILIDGGNKSFTLEKWSGRKCFMIGARELSIVWGDSPQYWKWRREPDSRFSEVIELVSVCWLELHGKFDTKNLSPKTTYVAYLVIRFAEGTYGLEHPLAEASVKFVGGDIGASGDRNVCLDPESNRRPPYLAPHRIGLIRRRFGHMFRPMQSISSREGNFPRQRGDGWMEIELGEFFNNHGEDGEVEMSLAEIKGGHWKAGLVLQGIELRPKAST